MLVISHLGKYIKSKLPFLCSDNEVFIMRVWKNVDVTNGLNSRNILYIFRSLDKNIQEINNTHVVERYPGSVIEPLTRRIQSSLCDYCGWSIVREPNPVHYGF